ncbi:hypothetical protein PG994_006778 [Apiospora phragmitis]|uniref:Uncharacterized protein n=1 Tax=Apiospora phragmitis TaxID=2905665 RepID=A0ABR1VH20_9PEZI
MSQPWSRFLATTSIQISHTRHSFSRYAVRSFSQTCRRRADSDDINTTQPPSNPVRTTPEASPGEMARGAAPSAPSSTGPATTTRSILDELSGPSSSSFPPPKPSGGLRGLGSAVSSSQNAASSTNRLGLDAISRARNQPTISESLNLSGKQGMGQTDWGEEPFHFHIYGHKHNCHITVTKPDRNAIISISAGQIGFRKSKRGTYDAAYQLCAYVIDKLHQGNWHNEIKKMEVVLRGFGPGREAATKVLLGSEGRLLRGSIVKVSDATRLKFGGTRSPKPRRLG